MRKIFHLEIKLAKITNLKSGRQITNNLKTNNMKTIKVQNLTSSNGNNVPNQFKIRTEEGVYFQSYSSIIVFVPNEGKTKLDMNMWDYSTTTGKYRNQFLGETKAETQRKIDKGVYELVDLNF